MIGLISPRAVAFKRPFLYSNLFFLPFLCLIEFQAITFHSRLLQAVFRLTLNWLSRQQARFLKSLGAQAALIHCRGLQSSFAYFEVSHRLLDWIGIAKSLTYSRVVLDGCQVIPLIQPIKAGETLSSARAWQFSF